MRKLTAFLAALAAAAVCTAGGAARPLGWSYASPTWSPDAKQVVFAAARGPAGQILVARSRGGGVRLLARAPIISQVAWSPDGRRIAFVSRGKVFVVGADGRGRRGLGRGGAIVWSPTSSQLAFDAGAQGPIKVANGDGSGVKAVAQGRYDRAPSWSPDGTQLVFSRAPTVGAVESLFVVGRDGGNLRALGIQGADASWAPDGRRLAFWQRRPDGVALTVANLGGSAPVAITRSLPAYSGAARWSPDGTRLVFTVCSEFGACRVDVGDASGDAVLILGSGAEPSWSPDGSRVAFSARRICRWSGVFTVRPDGGGLARVTPCR